LQIYIIFSELANYWDIKNHNETKKAYKTHFWALYAFIIILVCIT